MKGKRIHLVDTLEWGHSLALCLVQGVRSDSTVAELNLALGLLLP